MTKTINLDGLTSVKIKQSAYDMARFCWIKNLSEADVFASCVNAECTENADEVRRISAGEFGMLDTESYETLYLNGSGAVEIVTSALLVCPFDRGGKGGGSGGSTGGMELIGSYAFTYSGTTTSSTTDIRSDYIQILPEIPEKNRTFLIYAKMTSHGNTWRYNYSVIVKMFGNTVDETTHRAILYLDIAEDYGCPTLMFDTDPTQEGYGLRAFLVGKAYYLKNGYFSIDVYDMGVTE